MPNPRKPAAVHILNGTSKKARLLARVNELHLEAEGVGDPPEWLDADAKEVWDRTTRHPQYSKVLTPMDRESFINYCALWSQNVKNLRGDEDAPKMSTMDVQVLNSLRQHFGFTPQSRAKVNLPSRAAESKYDKFRAAYQPPTV